LKEKKVLKAMTSQLRHWQGKFGKEHTDRNALTLEDMNKKYQKHYGVTRTELNEAFLGDFDRSIRILEVGSNIGNQLLLLQKMGFENLYGIEINGYTVQCSKANTCDINIIQGSAFDIPFKDGYFDLVFTSGVLIHIAPSDIQKVLKEIHMCSNKYIWGFEYYADTYTEATYRGHSNLLWKTNFAGLYLDLFDDVEVVKEERMKYLANDNIDVMFLIEKWRKG
jgi:pseudaminic acid biosynthesis-associated methylase